MNAYRRDEPREDIEYPPNRVIPWNASVSGHGACQVDARSWFDARALAAVELRVEPGVVQLVRAE